jgi:5-methylcytosine-specific restriction endonuclease McrA
METRTLVLNTWGLPHAVLSWMDAITLVCQTDKKGKPKAFVLEEYDETVSSPSVTMFIPAVMQLTKPVSGFKRNVKFSKINVFSRDGWKCCYCGGRFTMKELNYDHVLPRRLGGRTVWENIVTSCYGCNSRKAGRTPEQAGMKLLRRPARPHSLPLHSVFIDGSNIPDAWRPYLNLQSAQKHGNGFYLVNANAA